MYTITPESPYYMHANFWKDRVNCTESVAENEHYFVSILIERLADYLCGCI